MANVSNHTSTADRDPAKSRDVTILVSVGLFAVGLLVVVLASAFSGGVDSGDFASLYPPYP
jgi:hypothetical protein